MEVEVDHDGLLQQLNDGEQNLEDEAAEMINTWNRDQLLKEIDQDRKRLERERENRKIEFYDGETEFSKLMADMIPLEGGRVYIKHVESNPMGKKINPTHTIFFDQMGYLEFNPIPFDSSIHSGAPIKLNLMEGPILPGMLKALIELREGEKANILIEPSMAYGPLGVPALIPADSALYYYVKIYKVWETSELEEILEYEQRNIVVIPPEEKIAFVEEHKKVANTFLKDNQPKDAAIRYKAAIKCLDDLPVGYLERSEPCMKLMVTLLINASITLNKLEMYKSATKYTKRALFFDPTNLKAYYHLAKARVGLSDYSGASKWIDKASKISPDNKAFDELRVQLDFQFRDERKKRDEILRRMSRACQ